MDGSISSGLPRLLYVGDVPVESTYHGSALIHRLLSSYPPALLTIVETSLNPSDTSKRLQGVTYIHEPSAHVGRLLSTRFAALYSAWLNMKFRYSWTRLSKRLNKQPCDAVLTVVHGFGWLLAARFAATKRLPLHLILHDDWPRVVALPEVLRPWLLRQFRKVYQQAATRWCVSPGMQAAYSEECGVKGSVLLPARREENPVLAAPLERLSKPPGRPVFAFAGTINTDGYAVALGQLARVLNKLGGTLRIFGPPNQSAVNADGLSLPNVEWCGLLPSDELIRRLNREADVLFVPMSFQVSDLHNMRMGFPSKLTDYTSAGLPMLIYGPPDCSAVLWAKEHEPVAEVISDPSEKALEVACQRLIIDPELRVRLANRAAGVGVQCFSASTAWNQLFTGLRASCQKSQDS